MDKVLLNHDYFSFFKELFGTNRSDFYASAPRVPEALLFVFLFFLKEGLQNMEHVQSATGFGGQLSYRVCAGEVIASVEA